MKKLSVLLALVLALMTPFALAEEAASTTHYVSDLGFELDFNPGNWIVLDKNVSDGVIDFGMQLFGYDNETLSQYAELAKISDMVYLFNLNAAGSNLNVVRQLGVSGLPTSVLPMIQNQFVDQYKTIYEKVELNYADLAEIGDNEFFVISMNVGIPGVIDMVLTQYMIVSGDGLYVFTLGAFPEDYETVNDETIGILETLVFN